MKRNVAMFHGRPLARVGARRDTKQGERQRRQNVGRNWSYRMVIRGGKGIMSVCEVCESEDERCSNNL